MVPRTREGGVVPVPARCPSREGRAQIPIFLFSPAILLSVPPAGQTRGRGRGAVEVSSRQWQGRPDGG